MTTEPETWVLYQRRHKVEGRSDLFLLRKKLFEDRGYADAKGVFKREVLMESADYPALKKLHDLATNGEGD